MDQSHSSEANSRSASQEIPRRLRNPMVHYHVQKYPPMVPILSHMHPVKVFPPYFLKIPSGCPTKIMYAFLNLTTVMFLNCSLTIILHLPLWFETNCKFWESGVVHTGRIILECVLGERGGKMWIAFIWLRIRTGGGLLRTW